MRLWMHGIGKDIPASVHQLKSLGFEAVVGNDPLLIQEANSVGLEVYLCTGAFSAYGPFAAEKFLARDIHGKAQPWFGSTCPNQPEVRAANLASIANTARTAGIRGILIDGARFASPASSPDPDAFYTCFCSVCASKAAALGFDFDAMQNSGRALHACLRGSCPADLPEHLAGLLDWFAFRRKCTTEHLFNFCQVVKAENPRLLTGIYIFTPALAALVGQSYHDLAGCIDIFAPMIYRSYPSAEGPACLNHEISALLKELTRSLLEPRAAMRLVAALTRLPMESMPNLEAVQRGFAPVVLGSETRQARASLAAAPQLIPIIQLDDEQLAQSIAAVEQADADGINFFSYNETWLERNRPLFESM